MKHRKEMRRILPENEISLIQTGQPSVRYFCHVVGPISTRLEKRLMKQPDMLLSSLINRGSDYMRNKVRGFGEKTYRELYYMLYDCGIRWSRRPIPSIDIFKSIVDPTIDTKFEIAISRMKRVRYG